MKKSKKRIDGEEEGESLNDYLQGVRGQIYWDCCTSKEANRVEDGEEDEPGEEEDGDSLTELYFQPKYQDEANRLKIDMKLEVIKAHLERKIEELGKKGPKERITISKTNTCGILGLSFTSHSAKHSPVQLEEDMLNLLDKGLNRTWEEAFQKSKQNVIHKKSADYGDFDQEADDLIEMMQQYT